MQRLDVEDDDLLLGSQGDASGPGILGEVGQRREARAGQPPDDRRGYFRQNAIRCQPSGRTMARGRALNVPTNRPLKAMPFQP